MIKVEIEFNLLATNDNENIVWKILEKWKKENIIKKGYIIRSLGGGHCME